MTVHILGAGDCLPGQPVPNSTLARIFGLHEDWIESMIGTRTRHFAVDLEKRHATSDLAAMSTEAARKAIASAGVSPEEIDLVVLSTATPDHLMPTTVNLVLEQLGLDRITSFQLQAGCSGAVQALQVAYELLRGRPRTALVIGADTCRKHMDFDRDPRAMRASELVNLALFGDGAGAVILRSGAARGLHVDHVFSRCEGLGRRPGQIIHWFGTQAAPDARGRRAVASAQEDYKAIADEVPRMSREVLDELLAATGWERDDVTFYLAPQLSGRMTDQICDTLEMPVSRRINCVAQTGNNGNALPFLQIARVLETAAPGHRALLIAIESSKWIKTGLALTMS